METNKLKLLFLIDVSAGSCHKRRGGNIDDIINLIKSAVIKLLLHFTTLVKDESKQLQWGFKFYNVQKQRVISKNSFKDVDIKVFEEFESELETLVESFCDDGVSRVLSLQKSPTHADDGYDRAHKLNEQLQMVVSDFQWHGPDICSPVKPSRRKSNSLYETLQLNAVFLLSDCPHSLKDIRTFATIDPKKAITSNSFFEEIMSRSLYDEFVIARKLRFYWIDTDVLNSLLIPEKQDLSNNDEFQGLDIVNSALRKMGGMVIPGNAIVQSGLPSTANLLNVKTGISSHSPLVPWQSLVQFYMDMKIDKFNISGQAKLFHNLKESDPICCVDVQPILQRHKDRKSETKDMKNNSAGTLCLTSTKQVTPSEDSSFEIQLPSTSSFGERSKGKISTVTRPESDVDICMRATLELNRLPITSFESKSVFLLSGNDDKFHAILHWLAEHQLCLAVDLFNRERTTGKLAVLQPLTSVSASLRLIKSDFVLIMDKIMLPNRKILKKTEQKICDFVGKLSSTINMKTKSQNARKLPNTVPQTGVFNPNVMSSSCVPEAKPGPLDKVLAELRNNDLHKQTWEKERQISKKLQQYYLSQKALKKPQLQQSTSSSKSPVKSKQKKSPGPKGKSLKKTGLEGTRKSPRKKHSMGSSFGESVAIKRLRSSTGPTRTDYIFNRVQSRDAAESVSAATPAAPLVAPTTRGRGAARPNVNLTEFGSEDELLRCVGELYGRLVEGGSLAAGVHMITDLVLHYCTKTAPANPQRAASRLIESHLLLTCRGVGQKHVADMTDAYLTELRLQTLLYMEVCSLDAVDSLTEPQAVEDRVNQMANMMRKLSFLRNPTDTGTFMQEYLLESYVASAPRVLAALYEELLQPLPPALRRLTADDASDDEDTSSLASARPASIDSNSSSLCPASNKSLRDRKPKRYSSFQLDNKRQIAVNVQKKEQNTKSHTRSSVRLASASKMKKKAPAGAETTNVRRSLFDDVGGSKLVRRSSVAVMENIKKTPKKSVAAMETVKNTPKKDVVKLRKAPKSHQVLKTKTVSETPRHKQRLGSAVWQRLERRRAHTTAGAGAATGVLVVEESPEKRLTAAPAPAKDNNQKPSLKRVASVQLARKSSFYSSLPEAQSRNVAKSAYSDGFLGNVDDDDTDRIKKLEARMKNPLLSPDWNEPRCKRGLSQIMTSPRRIKPKNLFSNIVGPSPQKALFFDSPSKNTRARSVFHPPEIEEQSIILSTPLKPFPLYSPSKNTNAQHSLQSPIKVLDSISQNQCDQINEHVASEKHERTKSDNLGTRSFRSFSTRVCSRSGSERTNVTFSSKARANLSSLFSPQSTESGVTLQTKSSTQKDNSALDIEELNSATSSVSNSNSDDETINSTPQSKSRMKRRKAPSPKITSPQIDKWPRKKSRAAMNHKPRASVSETSWSDVHEKDAANIEAYVELTNIMKESSCTESTSSHAVKRKMHESPAKDVIMCTPQKRQRSVNQHISNLNSSSEMDSVAQSTLDNLCTEQVSSEKVGDVPSAESSSHSSSSVKEQSVTRRTVLRSPKPRPEGLSPSASKCVPISPSVKNAIAGNSPIMKFSPLSSKGLLQLIDSPLLRETKSKADTSSSKDNGSDSKTKKSRKALYP